MAKKKTSQKTKASRGARKNAQHEAGKNPKRSKRKSGPWIGLATVLVLATISWAGMASYRNHYANQTDLSVIGNGLATIVQVHDPSCSQCRKLKSNTESAIKRIDGEIQYRIADLTSAEGRQFAAKHDARKVTLISFTGKGHFHRKWTGVRNTDALAVMFKELTELRR